jgi:putative hydrolase of the HAD superfamily
MLRAVLFDAGDTLFRVRGSVGHAYSTVAARHGVIVAPHDIAPRFRAAFQQMPPLAFPDAPADQLPQREYAWWKQVVATVFSGERFADFDAFFRELFESFAEAAAWELFPDVRPTLAALKARGLRLGLVSNFDGRLVSICNGLGIADNFDVLVMSGRAGAAKPDPRIFEITLARLGVEAAETVHVGDSEREDVEGARAAGLRAILIQRAAPADRDSHAVRPHVVRDLRQVIDCV